MINLVKKNLPAKIFALLAAVVLWIFIMNDQNPAIEGTFTVNIEVANAAQGFKVTQSVDTVKIKVKGPRSLFVNANASEFKAYVDARGLNAGTHTLAVQTILPHGFELVEIDQEVINVQLEKIVQKQMSADLVITGTPTPGLTVAKLDQSVQNVTLEGPKSQVEKVVKVVGYVGLSGNDEDFKADVPLMAVDADGKEVPEVKVVPVNVTVSVELARGLSKKVVSIKPVFVGDLPNSYTLGVVSVNPANIEIAGDNEHLSKISSVNTEGISLDKETKSFKKTVDLQLPEGITVTDKSVMVQVEILNKK